ncbi:MAG TPA: radical SAM protein [Bacteroidota bacterium]
MKLSQHNIFGPIAGTDEFYLVNLLSGSADVLSNEKAREVIERRYSDIGEYVAKGYLVDPAEEARRFRTRYADFLDARERDEIQLFFVPWYTCNFACSYCYQESYANPPALPSEELLDAFFSYVQGTFAGRRKYLTLFGGEPLLPGKTHRAVIERFLDGAQASGLETAVVTNGYTLAGYTEALASRRIREVQVTLDGPAVLHDVRRPLKGGGGTFAPIVTGIDEALRAGLTVNLRVVVDRENIDALPALARFASEQGWTDHARFKTQLGRNYELHTCQTGREKLLSRLEIFQELYRLARRSPEILDFHKPAFSVASFLFEQGELPEPLFDACPGTKTEWAFDGFGKIYSCTATVGKTAEALGTYYPSVSLNQEAVTRWEERDVTTIPACTTCAVRLACGGGCASVAVNATGDLHAPDCRPVRELLGMGIDLYFNNTKS